MKVTGVAAMLLRTRFDKNSRSLCLRSFHQTENKTCVLFLAHLCNASTKLVNLGAEHVPTG